MNFVADSTSINTLNDAEKPPEPPLHDQMTPFHSHFRGVMEMYAPTEAVAEYLDRHEEWFPRSAKPMQVKPIGKTGYALILGRFGALGFELEPKIGLDLLPQDHGVYRINTIPVPDYVPFGYDVDFQAQLSLLPGTPQAHIPVQQMTNADWTLDLTVWVQFPSFIHLLPQKFVQQTGDALLEQIVRQISRRLTRKVQEDFHLNRGLPVPKML
ncbi:MAG: hypothetical protein RLZZ435_1406 [Cyanobacteriota bacterium]